MAYVAAIFVSKTKKYIMNKRSNVHISTEEESQQMAETMIQLIKENHRNAYKVIVAGGRDFHDYSFMQEKLDELFWLSDIFDDQYPIQIVSGMAEGADLLAVRYADEHEMTKILFPANWKEHHRMAGILRNENMLAIATHLIAFWNGQSRDTKHMIEIAREKGIPVWVFEYK